MSKASDPFERVLKINAPLAPKNDAPLRDYLPGVWPTYGELIAFVRELATLRSALAEKDGIIEAANATFEDEQAAHQDTLRLLAEKDETQAARDVLAERERQKSAEGWTHEHDDSHVSGEMAMAGACYALASALDSEHSLHTIFTRYWPWDRKWWKPRGGRADLIRAGALILAEIERLDRAALAPETKEEIPK